MFLMPWRHLTLSEEHRGTRKKKWVKGNFWSSFHIISCQQTCGDGVNIQLFYNLFQFNAPFSRQMQLLPKQPCFLEGWGFLPSCLPCGACFRYISAHVQFVTASRRTMEPPRSPQLFRLWLFRVCWCDINSFPLQAINPRYTWLSRRYVGTLVGNFGAEKIILWWQVWVEGCGTQTASVRPVAGGV